MVLNVYCFILTVVILHHQVKFHILLNSQEKVPGNIFPWWKLKVWGPEAFGTKRESHNLFSEQETHSKATLTPFGNSEDSVRIISLRHAHRILYLGAGKQSPGVWKHFSVRWDRSCDSISRDDWQRQNIFQKNYFYANGPLLMGKMQTWSPRKTSVWQRWRSNYFTHLLPSFEEFQTSRYKMWTKPAESLLVKLKSIWSSIKSLDRMDGIWGGDKKKSPFTFVIPSPFTF